MLLVLGFNLWFGVWGVTWGFWGVTWGLGDCYFCGLLSFVGFGHMLQDIPGKLQDL